MTNSTKYRIKNLSSFKEIRVRRNAPFMNELRVWQQNNRGWKGKQFLIGSIEMYFLLEFGENQTRNVKSLMHWFHSSVTFCHFIFLSFHQVKLKFTSSSLHDTSEQQNKGVGSLRFGAVTTHPHYIQLALVYDYFIHSRNWKSQNQSQVTSPLGFPCCYNILIPLFFHHVPSKYCLCLYFIIFFTHFFNILYYFIHKSLFM